jgi:hypothetical protein
VDRATIMGRNNYFTIERRRQQASPSMANKPPNKSLESDVRRAPLNARLGVMKEPQWQTSF